MDFFSLLCAFQVYFAGNRANLYRRNATRREKPLKKFFTVLLWLCLAASVVALFTMAGEKASMSDEARKNKQKYDALKTMYDREKAEWQSAADSLNADNTALTLEKEALAAALQEARQEMDSVKAEQETLAAEKDEASGRLSEILAVLMPGEETPAEPETEQADAAAEETQPEEEPTEAEIEEAPTEPEEETETEPEVEPAEAEPTETLSETEPEEIPEEITEENPEEAPLFSDPPADGDEEALAQ